MIKDLYDDYNNRDDDDHLHNIDIATTDFIFNFSHLLFLFCLYFLVLHPHIF